MARSGCRYRHFLGLHMARSPGCQVSAEMTTWRAHCPGHAPAEILAADFQSAKTAAQQLLGPDARVIRHIADVPEVIELVQEDGLTYVLIDEDGEAV